MDKIIDSKCINTSICAACGGKCCKKSGCDYYVNDFEIINKQALIDVLDTGNVSIVSALTFQILPNKKKVVSPFLYLRARNIDRDIVDLLSLKKQCSMLKENGCAYTPEERPSGGLALIPEENGHCRMEVSAQSNVANWALYQNLLAKLVKRYSGMSVDQKFRIDAENFIYDILTSNFDGIAESEIYDAKRGIIHLVECCPEEYERAKRRYLNK